MERLHGGGFHSVTAYAAPFQQIADNAGAPVGVPQNAPHPLRDCARQSAWHNREEEERLLKGGGLVHPLAHWVPDQRGGWR